MRTPPADLFLKSDRTEKSITTRTISMGPAIFAIGPTEGNSGTPCSTGVGVGLLEVGETVDVCCSVTVLGGIPKNDVTVTTEVEVIVRVEDPVEVRAIVFVVTYVAVLVCVVVVGKMTVEVVVLVSLGFTGMLVDVVAVEVVVEVTTLVEV